MIRDRRWSTVALGETRRERKTRGKMTRCGGARNTVVTGGIRCYPVWEQVPSTGRTIILKAIRGYAAEARERQFTHDEIQNLSLPSRPARVGEDDIVISARPQPANCSSEAD